MADDKKRRKGMLDKFEPGAELGPIGTRSEREQLLNQLPPEERELAEESARLADLCQYFSMRRMDIPSDITKQVREVARFQIGERIRALKDINRALLEYLNDVGEDPHIRQ